MFTGVLRLKPLLLITTVFSSLAIFNILAIKTYIQDTKTLSCNTIKKAYVNSPKVAITFDDGPQVPFTVHTLAILKEKKARATFFVLGKNVEAHPELLQQIHAEGHEIGNHTYSHQRLTRLSPEGIKAELHHTDTIIFNITGRHTTLVRPPDNAYKAEIISLTQQLGYNFILWSIDTRDWANVSVPAILREIDKAKPGDIILFHDGVTPSHIIEALPKAIDLLQAKGFQLVTVSELLSDQK